MSGSLMHFLPFGRSKTRVSPSGSLMSSKLTLVASSGFPMSGCLEKTRFGSGNGFAVLPSVMWRVASVKYCWLRDCKCVGSMHDVNRGWSRPASLAKRIFPKSEVLRRPRYRCSIHCTIAVCESQTAPAIPVVALRHRPHPVAWMWGRSNLVRSSDSSCCLASSISCTRSLCDGPLKVFSRCPSMLVSLLATAFLNLVILTKLSVNSETVVIDSGTPGTRAGTSAAATKPHILNVSQNDASFEYGDSRASPRNRV